MINISDRTRSAVEQGIGDALVRHAEGGAQFFTLVEHFFGFTLRSPAGIDVKNGCPDADHGLAGALLGGLDGIFQKLAWQAPSPHRYRVPGKRSRYR